MKQSTLLMSGKLLNWSDLIFRKLITLAMQMIGRDEEGWQLRTLQSPVHRAFGG